MFLTQTTNYLKWHNLNVCDCYFFKDLTCKYDLNSLDQHLCPDKTFHCPYTSSCGNKNVTASCDLITVHWRIMWPANRQNYVGTSSCPSDMIVFCHFKYCLTVWQLKQTFIRIKTYNPYRNRRHAYLSCVSMYHMLSLLQQAHKNTYPRATVLSIHVPGPQTVIHLQSRDISWGDMDSNQTFVYILPVQSSYM